MVADLRDDKQYLIDHPGATPIATAQASRLPKSAYIGVDILSTLFSF